MHWHINNIKYVINKVTISYICHLHKVAVYTKNFRYISLVQ